MLAIKDSLMVVKYTQVNLPPQIYAVHVDVSSKSLTELAASLIVTLIESVDLSSDEKVCEQVANTTVDTLRLVNGAEAYFIR
jgi:hypothetical protein